MIKVISKILIVILLVAAPQLAQAKNEADELEDAQEQLICALASMASYNNYEAGLLVRDILKRYDFELKTILDESNKATAKAIIAQRQSDSTKILAISGTNEAKDAEVDLRLKMMPLNKDDPNAREIENFYESKLSKFTFKSKEETTQTELIMANTDMVHKGFQDYAEVILENFEVQKLISEVKFNANNKLIITGHSLGGAVAIVTAAKMLEYGVQPNQLQIVTFGAPAVGNKKFVSDYGEKINIKRITVSGDPIKKSLQLLGYAHIGQEIKYKPAKSVEHFPHMMAVYLDCALRNYYDAKGFDNNYMPTSLAGNKNERIKDKVYVAPMQIMKKSFTDKDFKYVKAALHDGLVRQLTTAVYDDRPFIEVDEVDNLAEFNDDVSEMIAPARANKCKYILVQYLQAKKMQKDKDGNFRVSLEEIIYDLNGFPKAMQTSSMTTKELTMIEAAIFTQEHLNNSRFKTES